MRCARSASHVSGVDARLKLSKTKNKSFVESNRKEHKTHTDMCTFKKLKGFLCVNRPEHRNNRQTHKQTNRQLPGLVVSRSQPVQQTHASHMKKAVASIERKDQGTFEVETH